MFVLLNNIYKEILQGSFFGSGRVWTLDLSYFMHCPNQLS